jgi:predicted dithiol-disulfide oxidoreductase (DUF899 family)
MSTIAGRLPKKWLPPHRACSQRRRSSPAAARSSPDSGQALPWVPVARRYYVAVRDRVRSDRSLAELYRAGARQLLVYHCHCSVTRRRRRLAGRRCVGLLVQTGGQPDGRRRPLLPPRGLTVRRSRPPGPRRETCSPTARRMGWSFPRGPRPARKATSILDFAVFTEAGAGGTASTSGRPKARQQRSTSGATSSTAERLRARGRRRLPHVLCYVRRYRRPQRDLASCSIRTPLGRGTRSERLAALGRTTNTNEPRGPHEPSTGRVRDGMGKAAREALLAREKDATRARATRCRRRGAAGCRACGSTRTYDVLTPVGKVDTARPFDGAPAVAALSTSRSGPNQDAGCIGRARCASIRFGHLAHAAHSRHIVPPLVLSRAPIAKIAAYKEHAWAGQIPWVSSFPERLQLDFGRRGGGTGRRRLAGVYRTARRSASASSFTTARRRLPHVLHDAARRSRRSAAACGTFLDLPPLGRQEVCLGGLQPEGYPQTAAVYEWWRRHDEYEGPVKAAWSLAYCWTAGRFPWSPRWPRRSSLVLEYGARGQIAPSTSTATASGRRGPRRTRLGTNRSRRAGCSSQARS